MACTWREYLFGKARLEQSPQVAHQQKSRKLCLISQKRFVPSGREVSVTNVQVPRHIAVIMDGNRRFGRQNHSDPLQVCVLSLLLYYFTAFQGHWAGGQTLVDFVQWCIADGVEIATVYAFSTENWNREAVEVVTLMTIFSKYAETFKKEALVNNVKIIVLSTNYNMLPLKVQQSVEDLQFSTKQCTGFTLNICLSYGSRSEIVDGCKFLAEKAVAGEIKPSDITESVFGSVLLTKGQPEPDVLIRTSGEYRLSNYLLWQVVYLTFTTLCVIIFFFA